MTNELGTTLSDIEAKAERKREVLEVLESTELTSDDRGFDYYILTPKQFETIRKYIEEN